MFTSGKYDILFEPDYSVRHRYLIKHQGVWKILETWASQPDWDNEVTDVIWLKNPKTMIASWWQRKNGRRYIKRQPEIVKDDELTILLLQAERS
jgi:hypothetical protein